MPTSMTRRLDDFFGGRRELACGVGSHRRPLTFVLGAGASLSSNAPTTPSVNERLQEATKYRLGDLVRERLHEIVDDDVRDAVAPLFGQIRPNVGYRLLAALSRVRRV